MYPGVFHCMCAFIYVLLYAFFFWRREWGREGVILEEFRTGWSWGFYCGAILLNLVKFGVLSSQICGAWKSLERHAITFLSGCGTVVADIFSWIFYAFYGECLRRKSF